MNAVKMTGFFSAILLALATDGAAAQSPSAKEPKEILPGAKLSYSYPHEVYVPPTLLETKAGLRLDVMVHAKEPVKGRLIFGAGEEKLMQPQQLERILWDVPTNKEMHRFSSKKAWVPVIPLSSTPDGKKLAEIEKGFDGANSVYQMKFHDLSTSKSELHPKKYFGSHGITTYCFTPDGAVVIIGAWGELEVEYYYCAVLERGKEKPRQFFRLARPNPQKLGLGVANAYLATVSPDGSLLAACVDGTIVIHDLKTGKLMFHVAPGAGTQALAFSPSKETAMLVAVEAGLVNRKHTLASRIIDVKTKKVVSKAIFFEKPAKFENNMPLFEAYPWPGPVNIYFSAKSEPRIAFQGKIHDAVSSKILHQFDQAAGAQISRDGKYLVRLVPSAKDKKKNGIEIWSLNLDN